MSRSIDTVRSMRDETLPKEAHKVALGSGSVCRMIRFGNTRKAELERRLASALPRIVKALQDGDRLVEVK